MFAQLKQSDISRRPFANIFVQQCRHRHQPPHRMINVQLLCDIHNLGRLGTIQPVAPGLMRSVLYPQGKAMYLTRGVAPRLLPLLDSGNSAPSQSKDEGVDLADVKSRLESLVPLVFHRRLRNMTDRGGPAHGSSMRKGQPIYGSVNLHDITRRLSEHHNLSLVPPHALLSLKEEGLKDKLKFTGMFDVLVHLRTGDIVSFKVLVEPEVDAKEHGGQQNHGIVLPEANMEGVEARPPEVSQ